MRIHISSALGLKQLSRNVVLVSDNSESIKASTTQKVIPRKMPSREILCCMAVLLIDSLVRYTCCGVRKCDQGSLVPVLFVA